MQIRDPERNITDTGPPAPSQPFAPDRASTRWSIGWLAPRILIAWLALDAALRFLPPEWLKLRPVLIAVRFPHPHGPFQQNLSIYTEQFIGEAAIEGNIPTQEQRPPIRFSTDALGFRSNPAAPAGKPPDVVVWRGASFTYGASLSDEETFPAQLTQLTGLATYNAGRFYLDPDGLPELDWLLARLPSRPAIAVYLHLEHAEVDDVNRTVNVAGFDVPDPSQSLSLRYAVRVARTWQRMSPFEILFTRAFKSVTNDRILPNPYRRNLHFARLPDGTDLLLRQYEVESSRRARTSGEIRQTAERLIAIKRELESRVMRTLFVLLPSRPTVYAPWLKHSEGEEAPARKYIDLLEAELAARNVTVVNGLTVLREGTEAEISTGQLSFYRDDNHWNPQGVQRIAVAVAKELGPPAAVPARARRKSPE